MLIFEYNFPCMRHDLAYQFYSNIHTQSNEANRNTVVYRRGFQAIDKNLFRKRIRYKRHNMLICNSFDGNYGHGIQKHYYKRIPIRSYIIQCDNYTGVARIHF